MERKFQMGVTRILLIIGILLSLALSSFGQGAQTASGTGYGWVTAWYADCKAAPDTIVGTTDSIIILDTTDFAKGKIYALTRYTITGVDSVEVAIYLDVFGKDNKTKVKRLLIDSLITQAGETIALPINKTEIANTRYRIIGKAGAKNGSKTIWQGGYINVLTPAIPIGRSSYNN